MESMPKINGLRHVASSKREIQERYTSLILYVAETLSVSPILPTSNSVKNWLSEVSLSEKKDFKSVLDDLIWEMALNLDKIFTEYNSYNYKIFFAYKVLSSLILNQDDEVLKMLNSIEELNNQSPKPAEDLKNGPEIAN